MTNETRQQLIDRLICERTKRIADEAERYKDKQMDEPTPHGCVRFNFLMQEVVYLKVGVNPVKGMITDIDVHPYGVLYYVCWGDTRATTPHYDFELTREPPIGV